METSSEETKGLIELGVIVAARIAASELNALSEQGANMFSRAHDIDILVGDVILHAALRIDSQLDSLVNRATKAAVVLTSVLVIGIVLGVVNVVLGAVAAQTIGGDLELAATIAEGEEAENAEQEADGLSGDVLDGAHVDSLGVVTEPIAKVDTRDHDLVELLAAYRAGHHDREESIFDITVTPWRGDKNQWLVICLAEATGS